ncbi:tryptophan synthase subunit beta [Candidatus Dependentiae bacterium]|nr:tryptophan synthase subunit beta [Candidatus Dependentiae bacterium]
MSNQKWYFGRYGGKFAPEILLPALTELEQIFFKYKTDKSFISEYEKYLIDYVGRPTPLYFAERFSSKYCGNNKVFIKREDLCHTGSHKLNNALGQALLTKKIEKKRVIAETGAGQHGVATATACALLNLECVVYMGKTDVERQYPNVQRMKLLGAKVIPVESGNMTLKDAVNEAMKDWVASHKTTHYILGSVIGPYPFPEIVSFFQSVIGRETSYQFKNKLKTNPDTIIACVGAGSNAIGIFKHYIDKKIKLELYGVEAGGKGVNTGEHSAKLYKGKPGVLHGSYTYLLQDKNGQIIEPYSISAGLDYPAVGPVHSYLKDEKIVKYTSVTDREALNAVKLLSQSEGIIPALESAHAVAYCLKYCKKNQNKKIVICLSGRGDKDLNTIIEKLF